MMKSEQRVIDIWHFEKALYFCVETFHLKKLKVDLKTEQSRTNTLELQYHYEPSAAIDK